VILPHGGAPAKLATGQAPGGDVAGDRAGRDPERAARVEMARGLVIAQQADISHG
jgi:hypothetical protein